MVQTQVTWYRKCGQKKGEIMSRKNRVQLLDSLDDQQRRAAWHSASATPKDLDGAPISWPRPVQEYYFRIRRESQRFYKVACECEKKKKPCKHVMAEAREKFEELELPKHFLEPMIVTLGEIAHSKRVDDGSAD